MDLLSGLEKTNHRMKFHGSGGEYFKIWIKNIALSILTLGIYSAWAKVEDQKYFLRSTELAGERFDYHADPIKILISRLIVIGLLIFLQLAPVVGAMLGPAGVVLSVFMVLLFVLLVPFFFVKSMQFKAKYTSYRNIRFAFRGKMKESYTIFFLYYLVPLFAIMSPFALLLIDKSLMPVAFGVFILGFLALSFIVGPKFLDRMLKFIFNNLYYGGSRVHIKSSFQDVLIDIIVKFMIFMMAGGIFVGLFFVVGIFMGEAVGGLVLSLGILIFYFTVPQFQVYLLHNYVWNRLSCEGNSSRFKLKFQDLLFVSFTNMLLVVFSLGLLFPFARVNLYSLMIDSRSFDVENLDQFVQASEQKASTLAEELGDALDFDFDFGV